MGVIRRNLDSGRSGDTLDLMTGMTVTKNCSHYFEVYPSIVASAQDMILDEVMTLDSHPLAFSFLLNEEINVFEMFLGLFFRRQDFYCIHIDIKVSKVWFDKKVLVP